MKEPKIGQQVPHVLALKTGDVVAIPTRDGRWAFGHVFRGATLGVFRCLSFKPLALELLAGQQMAFHVGFFCTPKQKSDFDWVYLGKIPFTSDDEAWPPPRYIEDVASPGNFSLYDKGGIIPASKQQVQGLQKQVMSSPASIRKRILENCIDWPICKADLE